MNTATVVKTATAVGYFRVSGKGQAGEHHVSLEVQQDAFETYCKDHSLMPMAMFTDVMTGKRDNRPEYLRMLDYIAQNDAGEVEGGDAESSAELQEAESVQAPADVEEPTVTDTPADSETVEDIERSDGAEQETSPPAS